MKRIEILGVPVDCFVRSETAEIVRQLLASRKPSAVLAVNPEKVMHARRTPELMSALRNAGLLIPDGIGVVLAARLIQKASVDRIPGAELMPEICNVCRQDGKSVFLLGGKPGVGERAAATLSSLYPGLQIAGIQHGYFSSEDEEELVERINESGAAALFVALGTPRQERWIGKWRMQLATPLIQGVGGTFDVLSGEVARAPVLFRALHLEWFYRLVTQPTRLGRQLVLPHFAWLVLRDAVGNRFDARRR